MSAVVEYGVYKYVSSQFAKGNEVFKTFLVNIINYGDAAKVYNP